MDLLYVVMSRYGTCDGEMWSHWVESDPVYYSTDKQKAEQYQNSVLKHNIEFMVGTEGDMELFDSHYISAIPLDTPKLLGWDPL